MRPVQQRKNVARETLACCRPNGYSFFMKLERWLKRERMSVAEFAEEIEVGRTAAYRYLRKRKRRPHRDVAKRIVRLTKGAVTLEDLYG